ncbi:hypothetical protein AXA44_02515 [Rhodococcus sp. SC4]|nr:hypothetical protein AXA44_02515 [Rhodococcus sp. SC4]
MTTLSRPSEGDNSIPAPRSPWWQPCAQLACAVGLILATVFVVTNSPDPAVGADIVQTVALLAAAYAGVSPRE